MASGFHLAWLAVAIATNVHGLELRCSRPAVDSVSDTLRRMLLAQRRGPEQSVPTTEQVSHAPITVHLIVAHPSTRTCSWADFTERQDGDLANHCSVRLPPAEDIAILEESRAMLKLARQHPDLRSGMPGMYDAVRVDSGWPPLTTMPRHRP